MDDLDVEYVEPFQLVKPGADGRNAMKRLSIVLLLAGCAGEASERWSGTVDTLANGAVRVTNPAQGVWHESSAWRLEPELVLGELEGPEHLAFGAISGLQADSEGRIYVLDRQMNALHIFTAQGGHVRTVGRSGGGPGEYSAANGLLWLSPDTLVVVDQRGNRYSILTREGEFVRSVPRGLGFYGWAFSGGIEAGRIFELSSLGTAEELRPVLLGIALRPEGPIAGELADLAPEAGSATLPPAVDTVPLPAPVGPLYESFSVRTDQGGMVIGVPFAARPVYRLDGRGGIWHGHGGAGFRVARSTLEGETIREIVLETDPAPVTEAELAEWQASETVRQFKEMGGRLERERIPKVKPYFDDIHVDPDGYLWASVPAGPLEMAFAVFDPEGRYLGRLRAEGLERVSWVQPVLRNGRLYVAARDELDVQRVYVFRVERTAEERAGPG